MIRIIMRIFFSFIETVSSGNLKRFQDWLHALADVLPVIHEAFNGYEDWTPTESQQVCIDAWTRANERIQIRTLGGIQAYLEPDFRLGVEYPLDGSSTYVYVASNGRYMGGTENHCGRS